MKRSEMIKKLTIAAISMGIGTGKKGFYGNDYFYEFDEDDASQLLSIMENLGMKPPGIEATNPNTGLFNGTKVHKWEPEE